MGLPTDARITWYGHSCFEIVTPGGRTILIDPWFANPSSPRDAASVDRCDLLLVTHGHFDHLGEAVAIASRLRPAWPCIHEMSLWLARRLPGGADQVVGMNKGGTVEAAGLRVTMTTADHSAGDWNAGRRDDALPGRPGRLRHRAGGRGPAVPRRRHPGLQRHDPHPRPVSTGRGVPAHRRPLHDGAGGGGRRRRLPRRPARHPDALRDVPGPDRHARTRCERRSAPAGSGT